MAKTCHFGQFLNDALRDQLVCGLIATNIQKRLLSEANLTAERALEISQAMETVEKGAKDFKEEHQDSKRQETETAAINVVRKPVPNRARPSGRELVVRGMGIILGIALIVGPSVTSANVLDIWHEHAGQAVQKRRLHIE